MILTSTTVLKKASAHHLTQSSLSAETRVVSWASSVTHPFCSKLNQLIEFKINTPFSYLVRIIVTTKRTKMSSATLKIIKSHQITTLKTNSMVSYSQNLGRTTCLKMKEKSPVKGF